MQFGGAQERQGLKEEKKGEKEVDLLGLWFKVAWFRKG